MCERGIAMCATVSCGFVFTSSQRENILPVLIRHCTCFAIIRSARVSIKVPLSHMFYYVKLCSMKSIMCMFSQNIVTFACDVCVLCTHGLACDCVSVCVHWCVVMHVQNLKQCVLFSLFQIQCRFTDWTSDKILWSPSKPWCNLQNCFAECLLTEFSMQPFTTGEK